MKLKNHLFGWFITKKNGKKKVTKHVEREKKKNRNKESSKKTTPIQEKYIWECDYDYFLKYFLLRNILK
jgi:hypothetical protein